MGAPRKDERINKHLRLKKKHVDYFEQKNIKLNPWIVDQMEKFMNEDKKNLT